MKSTLSLIGLVSCSFFGSLVMAGTCRPRPPPPPPPMQEVNTTDYSFTLIALNASYPEIDHKAIYAFSGINYVDRGVQNPRFSYPTVATLTANKLTRIPAPGDPGAALTIGGLDFGTSNMCCNYARLQWNSASSISFSARTSPFFIDTAGNLVWEEAPFRQDWYVCGTSELPGQKDEQRTVYLGLPFFDAPFQGRPEDFCVAVKLAVVNPTEVKPLGIDWS